MTAQAASFSVASWRETLNNYLDDQIAQVDQQAQLQASMAYSLLADGKRMRPLLYLATVAAQQEIVPAVDLAIAGSLELVHTYSLIHDDLPAMDNDDYRRGRPTNHRQFGEAMAILAGDGLLTLAFQWLGQVPLPQAGQLCAILARASGPQGMVAGQAIDIQQTGTNLDSLAAVAQLDALKTGALLTAPFQLAACRLNLSLPVGSNLTDFGHHFGVAFQIYDDLQDIHSTAEKMGKAVHKDQAEGKNTYPAQLGIVGAQQALNQQVTAAKAALAALPENWQGLDQFLHYFDGEIK